MKVYVLAVVVATALFSVTTHAAKCIVDPVLEANKQLGFDSLDGIFNKKDPDAVDQYYGETYLQHNPGAGDGKESLRAFLSFLPSEYEYEIGARAAEDDLVWVHARLGGGTVSKGVVVDVFRVKDGKMVEHWDYIQTEVPVNQTASGRPMFSVPSSPAPVSTTAKGCSDNNPTACVTKADFAANKALAAEALDAFYNKKDASAVDKYIGAELLQHNPLLKDGPDQLKSFVDNLPETAKFELGAQIANDDLVWTQGRYSGIPGQNTTIAIDIFRVKDGKFVEHWDVAQREVPAAQTVSGRPMFPIEP